MRSTFKWESIFEKKMDFILVILLHPIVNQTLSLRSLRVNKCLINDKIALFCCKSDSWFWSVSSLSSFGYPNDSSHPHTQSEIAIFLFCLQDAIDLFLGNHIVEETEGLSVRSPLATQRDWKFYAVSVCTIWVRAVIFGKREKDCLL